MFAQRRCRVRGPVFALALMFGLFSGAFSPVAFAQGIVSDVTQSPFVIGFVPVAGGGAVGGVMIDAKGVVSRAEKDDTDQLRAKRLAALKATPGDVNRESPLRKVSLRRLEEAIQRLRKEKKPVTDVMQNLAGLQRVSYVFIYPREKDIVLAGPAEGWAVGKNGAMVGRSTGRPVVQLADLVLALRTAESAAQTPISCSIDPTPEGLGRFRRMMQARLSMGRNTLRRMERVLGPQRITVKGIGADSHFARVMVSADFVMKRLAMGFEKSPLDGMPSYLDLVKSDDGPPPRNVMPRWWLAPNYEPLRKDEAGLAWRLAGPGIKCLTEDTLAAEAGGAPKDQSHVLAQQWADTLTKKYEALGGELPVFAKLRNCMDLAVVAALLVKEDLLTRAGWKLPLLMDAKQIAVPGYHVPKTVDPRASFVKKGREYVVSVSGGVAVDSWAIADKVQLDKKLNELHAKALAKQATRWWWD